LFHIVPYCFNKMRICFVSRIGKSSPCIKVSLANAYWSNDSLLSCHFLLHGLIERQTKIFINLLFKLCHDSMAGSSCRSYRCFASLVRFDAANKITLSVALWIREAPRGGSTHPRFHFLYHRTRISEWPSFNGIGVEEAVTYSFGLHRRLYILVWRRLHALSTKWLTISLMNCCCCMANCCCICNMVCWKISAMRGVVILIW